MWLLIRRLYHPPQLPEPRVSVLHNSKAAVSSIRWRAWMGGCIIPGLEDVSCKCVCVCLSAYAKTVM